MKIIIDELNNTEIVFIENENGSTVSMPKSIYDEQQAALEATPTNLQP